MKLSIKGKGFTLVELLVILVILTIIAIITIPVVRNIINESEEKASISSSYGVIKAADFLYASGFTNKNIREKFDGSTNLLQYLELDGKEPDAGRVYINKEGRIAIALKYGNKCYKKGYDGKEVEASDYDEDNCDISIPGIINLKPSDPNYHCFEFYDGVIQQYYLDSCSYDMVIPTYIDNIPVRELGYMVVYYGSSSTVTSIDLAHAKYLEKIGEHAFGYSDIEQIAIPENVTVIDMNAIRKNYSFNTNLTLIINKTGRAFNWSNVTGSDTPAQNFITGTIIHQNGNITVTDK